MRKMTFALAGFVAAAGLCSSAFAQFDSTKANKPVAAMAPKLASAEASLSSVDITFAGFLKAYAGNTYNISNVVIRGLAMHRSNPISWSWLTYYPSVYTVPGINYFPGETQSLAFAYRVSVSAKVESGSLCFTTTVHDGWTSWFWPVDSTKYGCLDVNGGMFSVTSGGIFTDTGKNWGSMYGVPIVHKRNQHEYIKTSLEGVKVYFPDWLLTPHSCSPSDGEGGVSCSGSANTYADDLSGGQCLELTRKTIASGGGGLQLSECVPGM